MDLTVLGTEGAGTLGLPILGAGIVLVLPPRMFLNGLVKLSFGFST